MSEDIQHTVLMNVSAVAIAGRALAIEGPPGSGKSSLALALIDRGAKLIGDDGLTLDRQGNSVIASPPANISGLLEVRGIGITTCPLAEPCPLALVLTIGSGAGERLPEALPARTILGIDIPVLPFMPGEIAPAPRAEMALKLHGPRVDTTGG